MKDTSQWPAPVARIGNSMNSPRYRLDPVALARVNLPVQIKCIDCLKTKQLVRFSKKQLTEYKFRICCSTAIQAQRPRCKECIGGPAEEKTCSYCDVTKAIDRFSQNQKAKDDAKCSDCQQQGLVQTPELQAVIHEEEILEAYHTNGSSVFGTDQFTGMTGARPIQRSLPNSNTCSSENGRSGENGGVKIQPELGPLSHNLSNSNGNSNRNGRRKPFSGSSAITTETHETHETTDTTFSNHGYRSFDLGFGFVQGSRVRSEGTMNMRAPVLTSDKWAKQRAVPRSTEDKVLAAVDRKSRYETEKAEQYVSHDGDEDDEEEDFQM